MVLDGWYVQMPDTDKIIAELNLLRNEDLLNLARNPAAHSRKHSIRLLVERGSHLAGHPDIATESEALIYSDPTVLKKADPASAFLAHRLPGLVDVLAQEVHSVRALHSKHDEFQSDISRLDDETLSLDENIKTIAGRLEAAEARLMLLEPSVWRKCLDLWKRITGAN